MTIDQGSTTGPNDSTPHLRTLTVLPELFRRRNRGTDEANTVDSGDAAEPAEASEVTEDNVAVEDSEPDEPTLPLHRDVREFVPEQRTPGSGPFGPGELWDVTYRTDFIEQIECRLASGESVALVTFGMDRFEQVNHSAGLEAGDVALRNAYRVLRWVLGPSNVAYFGSDCFAALLAYDEATASLVEAALDRLACTDLSDHLAGVFATASAGMVVVEDVEATADDLLYIADYALLAAKEKGGNRVVVEEYSTPCAARTETA